MPRLGIRNENLRELVGHNDLSLYNGVSTIMTKGVKYGETNADLALKVEKAQEAGLNTIFCIGELLEERQAGQTKEVCKTQLTAVFDKIKDWSKIVIAYEPVWAIGTGVVATVEQAQEAHKDVRQV